MCVGEGKERERLVEVPVKPPRKSSLSCGLKESVSCNGVPSLSGNGMKVPAKCGSNPESRWYHGLLFALSQTAQGDFYTLSR